MFAAIIAAELAFWILLASGLAARYLLRRTTLSSWLLRCVPLVDIVLVALVGIDVAAGAAPSQTHALAAVYLGVTLAFGRPTIAWADARFRYRFAGGPAPLKPAKGSRDEVRATWREWFRVLCAAGIAVVLILVLVLVQGWHVPASTEELSQDPYWGTIALTGMITVIWFLAGPAFAGSGSNEAGVRAERSR